MTKDMLVTPDSTFVELAAYTSLHSLSHLVNDMKFVSSYAVNKHPHETDEFYAFAERVVDMFHDHFSLTSKQRRDVTMRIMDKTLNISEIYAALQSGKPLVDGPSGPKAPPGAGGATAPYPATTAGPRAERAEQIRKPKSDAAFFRLAEASKGPDAFAEWYSQNIAGRFNSTGGDDEPTASAEQALSITDGAVGPRQPTGAYTPRSEMGGPL